MILYDKPPEAEVAFDIDEDMVQAAFVTVRATADASAYGSYVSDDFCRTLARDVVTAVEAYRAQKKREETDA